MAIGVTVNSVDYTRAANENYTVVCEATFVDSTVTIPDRTETVSFTVHRDTPGIRAYVVTQLVAKLQAVQAEQAERVGLQALLAAMLSDVQAAF